MKTKLSIMILVLALAGTSVAQTINVTPTGVGIGTAAPTQKLDVAGNVAASGNVTVGGIISSATAIGVGTTTPEKELDVIGDIAASGDLTVAGTISGGGLSNLAKAAFYESPEQQLPGADKILYLNHGLGGTPLLTTVSLRCKVSAFGYQPGDEVLLSSILKGPKNQGFSTVVNPTQIKLVQYGSIYMHRLEPSTSVTAGGGVFIMAVTGPASAENWVLVVRAWR